MRSCSCYWGTCMKTKLLICYICAGNLCLAHTCSLVGDSVSGSPKDPEDSKDAPTSKKNKEDSKDVSHSKKDKEVTDDVPSPKKQKSPISFFQCVYLDGYNGYGFQFPVTPAQHPGENPSKTNSPGQKKQEQ